MVNASGLRARPSDRWDREEIECSPGFEVVGDAEAKVGGIGVVGGFGFDLDHGFAVG